MPPYVKSPELLLLLRHGRNLATRTVIGNRLSTLLRSLEQVRLSRCLVVRLPVGRLLVCRDVEHDEENQVGAEDNTARNGSIRVAGASAHMG